LAIALFLGLAASMPLHAQHGGGGHSSGGHASGGGHASSGGHGGFSSHGSFSGHAAGGHAYSGVRSGSAFVPRSYARGSSRPALSSRAFNSRGFNSRPFNSRGFNRNSSTTFRLRTYGFRNNCYGYPCRYGYGYPWGYGAFDPYWWWDSGSSYDQDQQDQTGLANEMNQQSLDEQRMREQDDQDAYAGSAPPYQHQQERTEAAPATVLIFRDQHKQEVQNYAIVGLTLWTFDPHHSERIPLSDLDLAATAQANDDRGVRFRLPGS
jgi:hypothetical protein